MNLPSSSFVGTWPMMSMKARRQEISSVQMSEGVMRSFRSLALTRLSM